uniref:Cellular communication network factor 5 n=1 Tax=Serinus canaria TaxID=9135 RepID=A0A8C9NF25_SERCA
EIWGGNERVQPALLLLGCAHPAPSLPPQVCAQLCRRPCYCPWVPPRCPRGSPLVLDGCGCCKICARRLGEPCDFLHVCDQSQGLVCDYSSASVGTGVEDDEEGCEVNGRLYRDGEVFQPSCKIQCHCLDGGFTCIPLCQEDVRLPSPDCPFPRRVEIPGKCCPEAGKMQGTPGAVSPLLRYPCPQWGTEWSACSATCGLGFASRVSNQNRFCRLETQRRLCTAGPCPALPAALPAVSEGWGELLPPGTLGTDKGKGQQHLPVGPHQPSSATS